MSRTVSRTGGRVTTNHSRIRQWADHRDATPATSGPRDDAPLRFSVTETDPYVEIDWETFFERFERDALAFVYEPARDTGTGDGSKGKASSRFDAATLRAVSGRGESAVDGSAAGCFYKFVDRDTV